MKKPTAQQLLKSIRKVIKGHEELIATIQWWNNNRTDCAPLDCEQDQIVLGFAKEAEKLMLEGKFFEAGEVTGRMANYITDEGRQTGEA